jgi:acido-empty-quinoprotein group A
MRRALRFLLIACGTMASAAWSAPNVEWPTFNGDYSGRRHSPLTQVNAENVAALELAWKYKIDVPVTANTTDRVIKATPVVADGVMYFTTPDNCWALDARTGRQLWRFSWTSKGGIRIGNRGVGIYKDTVFFETPDNHLVALDAHSGKLRWSVQVADTEQQYFSTAAPIVIRNHVLVGVGGDSLDVPGYLQSRDPETGALQWRWDTEPKPGQTGADTWPNATAMTHGGGMTWMPGTYDPQLNLIYWGTGNPNPVHAGAARKGDNLWTCSIVAIDPDSGQLRWWFQASPHDTHDWDAVETPVLIDDIFDGKPRKLLAQASRNGYFFLLDRVTGKSVLSKPFIELNWSDGVDDRGQPIPRADKEPSGDGVLVSPRAIGATNWPAPTFNPESGLFYVSAAESYGVYYLTDRGEHPEGYAGIESEIWAKPMIKAIDYKTGEVRWSHSFPNRGIYPMSLMSTAGQLLFAGDQSTNFIAFEAASGRILWHYRMSAAASNGPMTYQLSDQQYVAVAGADTVYVFALKR